MPAKERLRKEAAEQAFQISELADMLPLRAIVAAAVVVVVETVLDVMRVAVADFL